MSFLPTAPPESYPHITLVITPYNVKGSSTGNYPEPLLTSLRDIVSQHSISGTAYQSAFYQDLKIPSRFYHLQTSPPEPPSGWPTSSTTSFTDPTSWPLQPPTTTPTGDSIAQKTQRSLTDALLDLQTYATLQSSDGLIMLGLNPKTAPHDHSASSAPNTTTVPFDAPLLLIATREIVASSDDARAQFDNEMRDQLRLFKRWMGTFPVAAGWRLRGYYAAGSAGDAKEQFMTLSGWKMMEEETAFMQLMVTAAEPRHRAWVLNAGRVNPDVLGEAKVWGRRIA